VTGAALRLAEPPVRKAVYLHPGQVAAFAEPAAVSTILGSCVGVCLWDPRAAVGGLNHFLLPETPERGAPSPRFGDAAMQGLLEKVVALGAHPARLRARVYGGACVLSAFEAADHLGLRNVQAALRFLEERGIPVEARATGGRRGRKLLFHTDDGTAQVREI
jgi:chemotaxis protein CheD